MAKKEQRPQPLRVCTYCGRAETPDGDRFTRDHVLPRSLFNVMDLQMITVLACADCQREKRYGDNDLRDFVNLHYAGSRHPEAWQQQLKIMQAILRGQSKIGKAAMGNRHLHAMTTDAGIYLGDAWEVAIPNENRDMFKTLEYIVRGLYRHEVGTPLPAEVRVSVAHIDTIEAPEVIKPLLLEFQRRGPFFRGQRVATWFSIHADEDPHSTIWVLEFNENVYFVGGTGSLARSVNELEGTEDALPDEVES
jgi:hypothetical protein